MSFLDSSPSFIEETSPPSQQRQMAQSEAASSAQKNWSEWRTPKSKKDAAAAGRGVRLISYLPRIISRNQTHKRLKLNTYGA